MRFAQSGDDLFRPAAGQILVIFLQHGLRGHFVIMLAQFAQGAWIGKHDQLVDAVSQDFGIQPAGRTSGVASADRKVIT